MTNIQQTTAAVVSELPTGWVFSDGSDNPSTPERYMAWAVKAALDAGFSRVLVETDQEQVPGALAWARALNQQDTATLGGCGLGLESQEAAEQAVIDRARMFANGELTDQETEAARGRIEASPAVRAARALAEHKQNHQELRETLAHTEHGRNLVEAVDNAVIKRAVREAQRDADAGRQVRQAVQELTGIDPLEPDRPRRRRTCKSSPVRQVLTNPENLIEVPEPDDRDAGTTVETEDGWPADRFDADGRQFSYLGAGNWGTAYGDDPTIYRMTVTGEFSPSRTEPVTDECGTPVGRGLEDDPEPFSISQTDLDRVLEGNQPA